MKFFSQIRRWSLLLAGAGVLASTRVALAASDVDAVRTKYGFEDPMGGTTVPALIGRLITVAFPLVGSLFLIMFIWSGFQWLTAGGDPKKVQSAVTTMRNAVIGIAIVVGAYMIVSFLLNSGSVVLNAGIASQQQNPTK